MWKKFNKLKKFKNSFNYDIKYYMIFIILIKKNSGFIDKIISYFLKIFITYIVFFNSHLNKALYFKRKKKLDKLSIEILSKNK
jgi:hypothetical protein